MKYYSAILTSLLLLGVCSGKSIENENDRQQKPWGIESAMQSTRDKAEADWSMDSKRGPAMNMANEEKWGSMSNGDYPANPSEIKDFVAQKVGDVYDKIRSAENSNDHQVTVYFDQMPMFAEPLYFDHVVDKMALATVQYRNVEFYGLNSAYLASCKVDVQYKKAVLTLYFHNNAELKGEYTISNLLRHSAGNFRYVLSGDVASGDVAYVQTFAYEYSNGRVELGESQGHIWYGDIDVEYENIGFFANLFRGHLSEALLESVNRKLYDMVNDKMADLVRQQIESVSKNLRQAKVMSALYRGIKGTFYGIQRLLSHSTNPSLQLTAENQQDYHYNNYHGKIFNVNLYGLQYFNMSDCRVTYTDNKVNAQFSLELPEVNASASISYSDGAGGPEKQAQVYYAVSHVQAYMYLEKELGVSSIHLRDVNILMDTVNMLMDNANFAQPQGQYSGGLNHLAEHLTPKVRTYMIHALAKFFKSELSGILATGYQYHESHEAKTH